MNLWTTSHLGHLARDQLKNAKGLPARLEHMPSRDLD
jgi:hypothetical protein